MTVEPGFNPSITSIDLKIGDQTRTIPFASDSLGRVIREKQPGIGLVTHTYDAFGDLTQTVATDDGVSKPILDLRYLPGRLETDDLLRGLQTQIQFEDPEASSSSRPPARLTELRKSPALAAPVPPLAGSRGP